MEADTMAHITYRVTGRGPDGKATARKFRNTDAGREAARTFADTLRDTSTFYDVRYRVGTREASKTFTHRKDADAFLVTTVADRLRGVVVDPRRARETVREYADRWLDDRHDLAEKTAELYRWLLDRHVLPRFGTASIGAVSPSSVRAWHATIAKDHPTTAAKAYRLLRAIFATAIADEIIIRNPCQVKGAGQEKAPERPVATIAEVQALADAMPGHLRIAVLLAAWCQLRRGELLGLRRRDIDTLSGRITISTTRVTTKSKGTVEKAPKTDAGRRTLTVPPNILPQLRRHLDEYVGAQADASLLVGEHGRPVIPGVLQAAWHRARLQVGRPDLHLHDLRHSGLTWAAATGATTKELMRRAGHASPAAALRYQHATEDRDQVLAEALAKLAPKAPIVAIAEGHGRKSRGMDAG
ncbi:MAG: site-specific integrase [Acidimicrobiales bacterium]